MLIKYIAYCLIFIVIFCISWIRISPNAIDSWHIDPADVQVPNSPNFYKKTYELKASKADVIAKMINPQLGGETSEVFAGTLESGFVTYISRTQLLKFPDFISIKLSEQTPESTQVDVFSRSKFGYSDLGRNKQRVESWISTVRQNLGS